jgi:hypothetical protein
MARLFESRTLSSLLRNRGARIIEGRFHDTIQHELDRWVERRGRPVHVAEVFPTSAGGPDSDLARINKARVILHVSAVQTVIADGRVVPFKQPHQIEACVRSALAMVGRLNERPWVFAEPGTRQWEEQESLRASCEDGLRSVLFPLFGTGQGGAIVSEVVGPMVTAMVAFVEDSDNLRTTEALRDMYVLAYLQDDLDQVIAILSDRLPKL